MDEFQALALLYSGVIRARSCFVVQRAESRVSSEVLRALSLLDSKVVGSGDCPMVKTGSLGKPQSGALDRDQTGNNSALH